MGKETLGVSKSTQKWATDKIGKMSDQVKRDQRMVEKLINWEHVDLSINTSGEVFNCVHTAVGNGLDHWWEFMSWQIPVGITAKLVFQTLMRWKHYAAGGEELGRNVELMLGMEKVGKNMPIEIERLVYSKWYDWTWLEMLNSDARDSLSIGLGGCSEALFWEGEKIVLYVKNSTIDIPVAPHASTLLSLPIQYLTNADLKRQIEEIKTAQMKARGIDAAD